MTKIQWNRISGNVTTSKCGRFRIERQCASWYKMTDNGKPFLHPQGFAFTQWSDCKWHAQERLNTERAAADAKLKISVAACRGRFYG